MMCARWQNVGMIALVRSQDPKPAESLSPCRTHNLRHIAESILSRMKTTRAAALSDMDPA